MEINWEKIIESQMVKAFRKIALDWLGIDVHFYDKSGNCKSTGVPFRNPFCRLIQSKPEIAKECHSFCIENLKKANKSSKTFVCKHFANLRIMAVPIIIDRNYFGAIVCSGIHSPINKDQKEESIKRLVRLGFDNMLVEQLYNKINTTTIQTEDYVLYLIKLATEVIAGIYKTKYKKERAATKQVLYPVRFSNEKYKNIVFKSSAMAGVFDTVKIIESTEKTILIEGETGTGKELLAAAIHANSPRKDKALIIQNCSAFHDALLSSELFGHVKGSFTGAVSDKKGLFQIADGGTLFLDEIADMSMENQANLLRILENGTFYKLGGTELQRVDVRIIAATNKDLHKQVEKDLFRKDLFYRINAIQITMPPLRERKDDIVPLMHYFLEAYAEAHSTVKKEVSPEVIKLFEAYDWPGNVRELKNQVERLIILSGSNDKIEVKLLLPQMRDNSMSVKYERRSSNRKSLKDILKTVERKATETELRKASWNKTIASRRLGISRASLNNKIENYNISRYELNV